MLTRNELVKKLATDPDFHTACAWRNSLVRRGGRGTEMNEGRYAVFVLKKCKEYFENDLFGLDGSVQLNILWYTHFIEVLELQSWCTGKML